MLVRSRTGHDSSSYKRSTVHRRVERRMSVHGFDRPRDYLAFMHGNSTEARALFSELLISVTSFFRDHEAFDTLKQEVLRKIVQTLPDHYELRVWVPACATGEEAYSVAILLWETMRELDRRFDARVFGTDLDERARRGVYPASIAEDVSRERLDRFFASEGEDAYIVRKEIRDMLTFAVQNVLSDPPFMRLDMLVCRNLLIYLQSELQNKLLATFHYALRSGGYLFLGSSESIGAHAELFDPVDNRWKIYCRRDVPAHLPELNGRGGARRRVPRNAKRGAHKRPPKAGISPWDGWSSGCCSSGSLPRALLSTRTALSCISTAVWEPTWSPNSKNRVTISRRWLAKDCKCR